MMPFWQWKQEQYAKDQAALTPRSRHQYYRDYGAYCNKERHMTEDKKPRTFLAAWTPVQYTQPYPPTLNVCQVGSMIQVTVRGQVKSDGSEGDAIMFEVNAWNLFKLSEAFAEASRKFEPMDTQ